MGSKTASELIALHTRISFRLLEAMERAATWGLSASEGATGRFESLTPFFRAALEEIDRFFGLESSFLLVRGVPMAEGLFVMGTTSEKDTLFQHGRFPLESRFLDDVASGKLTEGVALERRVYRADPLWEQTCYSMHLGPHAPPWTLAAIPFSPKGDTPSASGEQLLGCLILVGPQEWTTERTEDGGNSLQLMADQFEGAVKLIHALSRLKAAEEWMSSQYMDAVAGAGKGEVLHGIHAALQRQEFLIHFAERDVSLANFSKLQEHLENIRTELFNVQRCARTFLELSVPASADRAMSVGSSRSKKDWAQTERIVMGVVESLRGLAERKRHRFLTQLRDAPRIPMKEADFELVVRNLLHNAVKYSFPGTVIEVNAAARDPELILDFISHGIPIPDEDSENIFRPGFRTALASKMEYGASGIGLFSARRIVERHGGRLFVHASQFEARTVDGDRYRSVFRLIMRIKKRARR